MSEHAITLDFLACVTQYILRRDIYRVINTSCHDNTLYTLCCKALINKLISIWFHMGYFEIMSHSLEFL